MYIDIVGMAGGSRGAAQIGKCWWKEGAEVADCTLPHAGLLSLLEPFNLESRKGSPCLGV